MCCVCFVLLRCAAPASLGDGYCDGGNTPHNTADCGWDGGDCCAATCEDSDDHLCGYNYNNTVVIGYNLCADPTVCLAADPTLLGNGYCDSANNTAYNTEACGWDGGDCCFSTCVSGNYSCGNNTDNTVVIGFPFCDDPSACIVPDFDAIGDAICNPVANTENCGWDGGDCCNATCVNTATASCGRVNGTIIGYPQCLDPNVCIAADVSVVGNGFCDNSTNKRSCDWDGGDCCAETCQSDTTSTCGYNADGSAIIGFEQCRDPAYEPTSADETCIVPDPSALGNGYCNTRNNTFYNTALCDWDGGDCCASTCVSTPAHLCGDSASNVSIGFPNCNDPDVCLAADPSIVGNGFCDNSTNKRSCDWDGGDCCAATCVSSANFSCGFNADKTAVTGFLRCLDPDHEPTAAGETCIVEDQFALGNGYCNTRNNTNYNTALCGWDGGDCCASTCESTDDHWCGFSATNVSIGYANCRDPSVCPIEGSPRLGDGFCDTAGNLDSCDWDGGDCCAETCVSTANTTCGFNADGSAVIGFLRCLDPNYEPTAANETCIVANPFALGNGYCNTLNNTGYNTALCNWDGGDCCAATCESTDTQECGFSATNVSIGFANCRDPDVCIVANISLVGNGGCDDAANKRSCDWDGGDCCAETCVSGSVSCGFNGDGSAVIGFLRCLDPAYEPTPANASCIVEDQSALGNGYCNTRNNTNYNTARCNWDGGDCCASTCVSTDTQECGFSATNVSIGFANCRNPDICPVEGSPRLSDAVCDDDTYNNLVCGWDGGDCCESSCESTGNVTCGYGGVNGTTPIGFSRCRDPDNRPVVIPPGLANCSVDADTFELFANGICDNGLGGTEMFNTADCAWDGGDCCAQTCVNPPDADPVCGLDTDDGTSIGFFCLDPSVMDPITNRNPSCQVPSHSFIGDGYCDGGRYNVHNCSWDGGDCCDDTCNSTTTYVCGQEGFDCQDPGAFDYGLCPNYDPKYKARTGNGVCDQSGASVAVRLNRAACDWDGGDCCPSTCNSTLCSSTIFWCNDPNASDYGTVGTCSVPFTSYLGDGACDEDGGYNTEACGWDGGDCCASSCVELVESSYTCGNRRFVCLDPNAPENAGVSNTSACQVAPASHVGDGYCDFDEPGFNRHRCGWDGGDCCPETCQDGNQYTCDQLLELLRDSGDPQYADVNNYSFCLDPNFRQTTTTTSTTTVATTTGGTGATTTGGTGATTTGGTGATTTTSDDGVISSASAREIAASIAFAAALLAVFV